MTPTNAKKRLKIVKIDTSRTVLIGANYKIRKKSTPHSQSDLWVILTMKHLEQKKES